MDVQLGRWEIKGEGILFSLNGREAIATLRTISRTILHGFVYFGSDFADIYPYAEMVLPNGESFILLGCVTDPEVLNIIYLFLDGADGKPPHYPGLPDSGDGPLETKLDPDIILKPWRDAL